MLLLGAMGSVLLILGFVLGYLFGGPQAGWMGMLVASGIWLVMMLVSLSAGDQIMLSASKAVPVTHEVHPVLFNVVEEMKIAGESAEDAQDLYQLTTRLRMPLPPAAARKPLRLP